MSALDVFQVTSIAWFTIIVIIKASLLRFGKRINPVAVGRGKKGFSLFFELFAFAGLLIWLIEVVLRAFHSAYGIVPARFDPRLIDSTIATYAGVLLVIVALAVFALAFWSFGSSWRVGLDTETPGALVTRGIFRLSRNPIFVSLDLWFIGMFLINSNLFFLVFAVVALVLIHVQIRREEKFLKQFYGQPYRDYFGRTARYLIW